MLAIGLTDIDWFDFLSKGVFPQINFWTPTQWNIRQLRPSNQFYFLLKAPYRKIGGYGEFDYYKNMSAKEAWNTFGEGNGLDSFSRLVGKITGYASRNSSTFVPSENPNLGCIVLRNAVFLHEEQFFRPEDYGISYGQGIQRFKYVPDRDFIGDFTSPNLGRGTPFQPVDDEPAGRSPRSVKPRPQQAQFRQDILRVYGYNCAISRENCVDALEAAHIQRYVNSRSNHVQNGIALRADLHNLFDTGLITIDQNYRVRVSPYLQSTGYKAYDGTVIALPIQVSNYPSKLALELHEKTVFRG